MGSIVVADSIIQRQKELLDLERLLYRHDGLEDFLAEEKVVLGDLQKLLYSVGWIEKRIHNLHYVLDLLHEARKKDEDEFVRNVFLPWTAIEKKTSSHASQVYCELFEAVTEKEGQEKINTVVRVYRGLVSDLFDPYLTLIVACYQFLEEDYSGIQEANLGMGEFNKAEYALSRARDESLGLKMFEDYDRIVRNAVSHAGSDGVNYEEDAVLFKSIKRGKSPKVETTRWSHDELSDRTFGLLECIRSIDIAANVFGVDCLDLITGNFESTSAFANYALDKSQRSELRSLYHREIDHIRERSDLTEEKKFSQLGDILKENLQLRDMPFEHIYVPEDMQDPGGSDVLFIDVPVETAGHRTEKQLRKKILHFPRYAVVARSIFHDMFNHYYVRGIEDSARIGVVGLFVGTLLDEYAREEAGLLDIINESDYFLEGGQIQIDLDFEQISEAEDRSLDPIEYPRKAR